jgi:hypothetical protein
MKKYLFILLFISFRVHSSDYVAVGGGSRTFNSQVSLEGNLRNFQELTNTYPNVYTYFGAGNDEEVCDVIEKDGNIGRYSSVIFDLFQIKSRENYNCTFRHNNLQNLTGPSELNTIQYKILQLGSQKKLNNDLSPFRFYFTGHGSAGSSIYSSDEIDAKEQKGEYERQMYDNNTFSIWDGEPVNVQYFTSLLENFPTDAPIQLMMVQCYSGGFSQINYVGGKLDLEKLSPANRCGFFAQVESEESAGCTTNAFSNVYYSNYFFEAYRLARNNDWQADYNHDGAIGSNEAHAYALIHSNTSDKSMTTSSMLINDLFSMKGDDFKLNLPRDVSWKEFKRRLSPEYLEVIKQLSQKLDLDFEHGAWAPKLVIINFLDKLDKEKELAQDSKNALQAEFDTMMKGFRKKLQGKWPYAFLVDDIQMDSSIRQKSKEQFNLILKFIVADKDFQALEEKKTQINTKSDEIDHLDQKSTVVQRINNIFNEYLSQIAFEKNPDYLPYKQKYDQLKACEKEPYFVK